MTVGRHGRIFGNPRREKTERWCHNSATRGGDFLKKFHCGFICLESCVFFAGKKCQYAEFSRWWFQKIFIFPLKLAEDFQFEEDFSDGLKPPTSLVYQDGLKLFTMKPYMKELLNQFLLM